MTTRQSQAIRRIRVQARAGATCCSWPAGPWRARSSTSSSATAGPASTSSAFRPSGTTRPRRSFRRCARRSAQRAASYPVDLRALWRLRHRRPARSGCWRRRASSASTGPHCYAFFCGNRSFAARADDDVTAFFLTDYLARHFDKLIWAGLGLDRHPELLPLYFGNYTKIVYLAQTRNEDTGQEGHGGREEARPCL